MSFLVNAAVHLVQLPNRCCSEHEIGDGCLGGWWEAWAYLISKYDDD